MVMLCYNNECDMWFLHIKLYEVLGGDYLNPDAKTRALSLNPNQNWHRVDEAMKGESEICKKLLSKNPKDRLSSSKIFSSIINMKV